MRAPGHLHRWKDRWTMLVTFTDEDVERAARAYWHSYLNRTNWEGMTKTDPARIDVVRRIRLALDAATSTPN